MTPRERALAVLHGEQPDCVPCCPDISNMVPARMTGKPFWRIYAYQDPPLWKAHIAALKHFDLDGGFELMAPDPFDVGPTVWEERVIERRDDGGFVTRRFNTDSGAWAPTVVVYTADNPPGSNVLPEKIGLPSTPTEWEPLTGVKEWPRGLEAWNLAWEELGDQGVLGLRSGSTTCTLHNPDEIYAFHDDPKPFYERRDRMMDGIRQRLEQVSQLERQPDFLFCGGSGSLVWQSPTIFRELALPALKLVTELAADLGIPTHVHSCGPETQLVKMAAEETDLTVVDPLEIPPMGDCDLAELKQRYGDKIVLKGNLHTTETMLRGSVDDAVAASKQAIDAAGAGGGFILSTGDQCGRDTPDENIHAMVETARTYGKY